MGCGATRALSAARCGTGVFSRNPRKAQVRWSRLIGHGVNTQLEQKLTLLTEAIGLESPMDGSGLTAAHFQLQEQMRLEGALSFQLPNPRTNHPLAVHSDWPIHRFRLIQGDAWPSRMETTDIIMPSPCPFKKCLGTAVIWRV